ncbi:16S rRNA (guanine(527)-N(7))-methyltransferase RsmG [Spongisporangium articulatum]|uniref:Ribosomal RNA small subunit methyltransferase G n=1 Tax=Spongisporangium articulatum TaxID=3362603 RepID=A0ABW8AJ55_9ACTN
MTDPVSVPRGTSDAVAEIFGDRVLLVQRYVEALSTSGLERGLIGPREVPRIWDRHVLNCAVVSELIPPSAALADVGSGAGLPGLVLAIARPDLKVTLIEPLLRRSVWLREVVQELGLSGVEIARGRADEVTRSGARFDVATARAVAALPKLAGWCLPLLRPQGQLLALKGASAAEELDEARAELTRLGAVSAEVVGCGVGVVDPTTTVIRVTVGAHRSTPAKPSTKARRNR